jgi:curli biogenesis system outer membrane secretion channel CsgG
VSIPRNAARTTGRREDSLIPSQTPIGGCPRERKNACREEKIRREIHHEGGKILMKNRIFILSMASLLCIAALLVCLGPAAAEDTRRAAMLPIKTGSAVHQWWSGDFEPGTCMTELLNGKLANSKRFNMYDRENLDKIMQEHNLSIAGEVSPETAIKVGELTGVKYLVSGTVIEFSEVNTGGSSGFSVGFGIGVSSSSKGNKVVRVKTVIKLTDTETGLIAASAESTKEIKVASGGGSLYIGGIGGGGEGGETAASGLGKGMEEVATELATKLESVNIKEEKRVQVSGYVMDIDGDQIYIGLDKPEFKDVVKKGYRFQVTREKTIKDPRSLTTKTINRPVGDIQVMSVDGDVIIGKASATSEPVQKNDRVVTK